MEKVVLPALAGALATYQFYHSTRADFLRRCGRGAEAADAYCQALALVQNPIERRPLQKRLGELEPETPSEE